jgi:hypothetical protein
MLIDAIIFQLKMSFRAAAADYAFDATPLLPLPRQIRHASH